MVARSEGQRRAVCDFVAAALFNWKHPIASFGSVSLRPSKYYYRMATFSTTGGMSGGPVISPNNPEELLGIVMGGDEGFSSNIILDVRSHPIIGLHNELVNLSH